MIIAAIKEIISDETRVAIVPETAKRFIAAGLEVRIQRGAGQRALLPDSLYMDAGACLIDEPAEALAQADILLKVSPPSENREGGFHEADLIRPGAVLVCMLAPTQHLDIVSRLARAGVTSFAIDAVPRIARAQSMDALSSMASLAGYKAVLLGADAMVKIAPMMMTAAGTIRPANALVIGAGVAGLQAIATARRLGAIVKAIDVRPAAAEQVESLGAKFIPMEVSHAAAETAGGYAVDLGDEFYRGEQDIIAPHLAGADMVITTAMIPNRPAPRLITAEMVATMAPGGVIVDLAAAAGGNCTLTRPDETVVHDSIKILGPTNLPAQLPLHASLMFARNVAAFCGELLVDGKVRIDMENEILRATLITRDGEIVHETTRAAAAEARESSQ